MADATPDDQIELYIDGKTYTIEPNDMELWEIELLEDVCDSPIELIDFNRVKAMRVLVYLLRRREDPEFTMDDARHVKLGTLEPPEETPEPAAAKKPAAKRRPTRAAAAGATKTG